MNKFNRLLYILNKLDQREKVRASELAKELEVSERTIYRYINSLIEAGFPIYYDRDKKSYSFTENFSLRRALLQTEEALILALARKFLEPLFGIRALEILSQIERKIIFAKGGVFDTLLEALGIQNFTEPPYIIELLKDLSLAIREYLIVKIEYQRDPEEEILIREVEPYFIFYTGDFWYLQAWCRTKEAQRTFALDKIRSWELTEKRFVPRRDMPSVEEIYESFGPYIDQTPKEVVVQFSPEVKQYFLRRKWLKVQECRELQNGWLEVKFKVRGLEGFKHWLYRWLPYFKIVSPPSLRDMVNEDLTEYVKTIATSDSDE